MLNDETVYEVKSDEQQSLTPQQIKDIQEYYETVKQKYISIRYYAQCSSTYGPDTFFTWFPCTADLIYKISSTVVKSSSS